MKGLILLLLSLYTTVVNSDPKEAGYFDDIEQLQQLRLQTSPNAVPRIGRRSDKNFPHIELFKRGVPLFTFPLAFGEKGQPLAYGRNARVSNQIQPYLAGFPPDYKVPGAAEKVKLEFGGREDEISEENPTNDVTQSQGYDQNNLQKRKLPPGFAIPAWRLGKRFTKKSAEPPVDEQEMEYYWRNILRSPQGFRFHDTYGDPFHSSRYKRGRSLMQELNSVPLLGKREELNEESKKLAM